MTISVQEYLAILENSFATAEQALVHGKLLRASPHIEEECDIIFASQTQAYREVLLGCLLVRITDRDKDIHLPYIKMGASAFSGRSLDEKVVNPFLRGKKVPCSRGPYLSVFRRQVRFDESTKQGLKDQKGYDAFLGLLGAVASEREQARLTALLDYVLYRFVLLREESGVRLIALDRISRSQYQKLIGGLLARPSGGFFPLILVAAMIETIVHRFALGWQVSFQGINVADRASGVGGDIVIQEQGKDVITVEVTERPVNASRVVATFTDKIAPLTLTDYVFAVHLEQIGDQAKQQAEKYFAQGYDVSFVDIQEWVTNTLAIVGNKGREHFQQRIIYHLSGEQVPKALKVAWNEEIARLTA